MSRATPRIRDLAARLIADKTGEVRSPGTQTPGAFAVCEKLRPRLATLMGRGGAHALLSRALNMARAEVDWLGTVLLTEEGAFGVSDEVLKKVDAKELTEGGVLLVAQLLGLLVAFIGDSLTLRLVRDVWPKLSLEGFNFSQREPHEEA